jgi:hypothetical protein
MQYGQFVWIVRMFVERFQEKTADYREQFGSGAPRNHGDCGNSPIFQGDLGFALGVARSNFEARES